MNGLLPRSYIVNKNNTEEKINISDNISGYNEYFIHYNNNKNFLNLFNNYLIKVYLNA